MQRVVPGRESVQFEDGVCVSCQSCAFEALQPFICSCAGWLLANGTSTQEGGNVELRFCRSTISPLTNGKFCLRPYMDTLFENDATKAFPMVTTGGLNFANMPMSSAPELELSQSRARDSASKARKTPGWTE